MPSNSSSGYTLNRRTLVATAAGGALALASHPASAQRCPSPLRAKGPPIWLDLDQQELDDAYNQNVYAFNVQNIFDRVREANVRTLARLGAPQRVAYGTGDIEKLDIYRTQRPNSPTLIYIHGGAWLNKIFASSAFQAEMFVNAGANFVAVDFNNVDQVGGDLLKLADQCRRAVAWVYRNAASFGGDRNKLYLAGTSSGAHLASCVLMSDWAQEGLPPDIVKRAILGSGMYDLKAVRLSWRSSYVKFTDETEQALSAQRHLDKIRTPLVLTYGTLETPEFQRQTREFFAALKAAGKQAQLLEGTGYNHFEMFETLSSPYGVMGRPALEMMGLTA